MGLNWFSPMEKNELFSKLKATHDYLSNEYVLAYLTFRVFLVATSLFSMHVFGYIHRLGLGVRPFIGLEVAADLFADIVFNFLMGIGVFGALAFVIHALHLSALKLFPAIKSGNVGRSEFTVSLCIAIIVFIWNYLDSAYWFRSFGYSNNSLALVVVGLGLVVVAILMWLRKLIEPAMVTYALVPFLFALSYSLGVTKAGSVPEYAWKQVIFSDGTRMDGYPLHRVRDGMIFRKRRYFSFDTGAIFIPYSSVMFVTEPPRDSGGGLLLSGDYPSIVITAP